MTKKYIITIGRICALLFAIFAIESCDSQENAGFGDVGYHLAYRHVPAETLTLLVDNNQAAELHLFVLSSLKDSIGYNTPQHYYLQGEASIEKQIATFLDPEGCKYKGDMPIEVCYTTEECSGISIFLYDENRNFVSDITNKAQFSFCRDQYDASEIGCNLVIDKDCHLVGRVLPGLTIQEYMDYHPMLFAEARFLFPNLDKDVFSNGKYAVVEIELANGTKLVTCHDNCE